MTTVRLIRQIAASPDRVFEAASDIRRFPEMNPDVVAVEFLTEQHSGVGTRFRETRRMKNREMVTELEVTEYDPARRRIRMVTDMGGTVWDTVFEVGSASGGAEIRVQMDCRAHKLLPKLLNPLLKGFFRRGMVAHMDAFTAWCEAPPR
jgi:uncharacterized protein YndB with AHSA1/START domain